MPLLPPQKGTTLGWDATLDENRQHSEPGRNSAPEGSVSQMSSPTLPPSPSNLHYEETCSSRFLLHSPFSSLATLGIHPPPSACVYRWVGQNNDRLGPATRKRHRLQTAVRLAIMALELGASRQPVCAFACMHVLSDLSVCVFFCVFCQ